MRPILFSLGPFSFYSAPLFAGLSALAAYAYFRLQRGRLGLSEKDFWNLMLALVAGVVLGSFLLHAAFYGKGLPGNLRLLLKYKRPPGGSFYGGFWGAALALYLYGRSQSLDARPLADVLGASAMLGMVVMRTGCLLHGCCYGRPSGAFWGLVFTDRHCNVKRSWLGTPLHPYQLYDALGCLLLFLFLHFLLLPRIQEGKSRAGTGFLLTMALYSLLRIGLEPLGGFDRGLVTPFGLRTGQSIALLSLGAAALLHLHWSKAKTPPSLLS